MQPQKPALTTPGPSNNTLRGRIAAPGHPGRCRYAQHRLRRCQSTHGRPKPAPRNAAMRPCSQYIQRSLTRAAARQTLLRCARRLPRALRMRPSRLQRLPVALPSARPQGVPEGPLGSSALRPTGRAQARHPTQCTIRVHDPRTHDDRVEQVTSRMTRMSSYTHVACCFTIRLSAERFEDQT